MCVFCLEPLWHVPASSSRGPGGGGGQRRIPRQDVPGKDSPNRHSKVRLHTVSFLHPSPFLLSCFSVWLYHSCLCVCRVIISTRATPAVTLCQVTPPAATVTSAGSTEELEETEEAWVTWVTRLTLTPTFLTREAPTTAASTPRLITTALATETTSHTRPCTPLRSTVASRNCRWEGAAVGEKQGDESRRPSYQLQPVRTKGIGQGHSHLLAAVLIKWTLSNPGKRPHHWWGASFMPHFMMLTSTNVNLGERWSRFIWGREWVLHFIAAWLYGECVYFSK